MKNNLDYRNGDAIFSKCNNKYVTIWKIIAFIQIKTSDAGI